MTTQCTTPVLEVPVKFLGATLLSMSANMGWGIESSTLNVELVEDCTPGSGYNPLTELIEDFPADNFIGNDAEIIGAAAYFSLPAPNPSEPEAKFRFGGIITNWTTQLNNSGLTYQVTLTDPREVLNNTIIITDSYSDLPFQHINYYNVYAAYEAGANYGNCTVFGTANSTQRGMSYNNIIKGLLGIAKFDSGDTNSRLNIFSPTTDRVGYAGLFKLDLGYDLVGTDFYETTLVPNRIDGTELPLGPEDFKITDKVSILELIQNICQITGRNFYTNLVWDQANRQHVIKVSTVSLQQPIDNIFTIVPQYKGYSSELSYGRELRNEKSRKLIFGEQVHYLSNTTQFTPFFGLDSFGNPIYPIRDNDGQFVLPDGNTVSDCGFWIYVDISALNTTLQNPISSPSATIVNNVWISELDIRAALASYELWQLRTFAQTTDYAEIEGSLVRTLQTAPVYEDLNIKDYIKTLVKCLTRSDPETDDFPSSRNPMNDFLASARRKVVDASNLDLLDDLDKIHKFITNLGQTYYGKQFLTRLYNNVCVTINNEEGAGNNGFGEKIFSETPTNDGGWVDYGVPVLGLQDPFLGLFRLDDDRIKPFAMFSAETSTNLTSSKTGQPQTTPMPSPPTPPEPPTEE